jgi:uncharacterized protein (UPF0332 family)
MDSQRQQTLWAIALENYQAAVLTAQQGWHNVSVSRSYYAVFRAMWVALDDPPRGYWVHRGISKPFALGHWRMPPRPLERDIVKAIRRLYEDRLDADYQAVRLTALESTAGLTTVRQVLRLVASAHGLSLEGLIT